MSTRVCKNTKINFEALTYSKKLVFVSKYMFLGMGNLNLGFIKANFAIKLCFYSFLGFFWVNWGQKLGMKD